MKKLTNELRTKRAMYRFEKSLRAMGYPDTQIRKYIYTGLTFLNYYKNAHRSMKELNI
jgi:hypothetical protein